VSTALYYSAETGVGFTALDPATPKEGLASTGSDPNAIIWAVLGGLVVLAAVFLRPKRRKAQAESTKAPSDLKE
jgi:LPXTG-motif cell wall-anchored protein